jgi:hypothetical protein
VKDVATDEDMVGVVRFHLPGELFEDLFVFFVTRKTSPVNVSNVSNPEHSAQY